MLTKKTNKERSAPFLPLLILQWGFYFVLCTAELLLKGAKWCGIRESPATLLFHKRSGHHLACLRHGSGVRLLTEDEQSSSYPAQIIKPGIRPSFIICAG